MIENGRFFEHEHMASAWNDFKTGVGDRRMELFGIDKGRQTVVIAADDESWTPDLVEAAADVDRIGGFSGRPGRLPA